jgi:hypothetical protein
MYYSDFTIAGVVKQFALTTEEGMDLYTSTPSVALRPEFEQHLAQIAPLALNFSTEKARSEFIIAPVLAELWLLAEQRISLFSGVDFTVDPENGLAGVCDYIITRSRERLFISAPVILVVEAKNEDMRRGYAQCIAEMLAAQRFNESEGAPSGKTYGAVTIGNLWKFLELEGATVRIDQAEYGVKDFGKIMGILMHMAAG